MDVANMVDMCDISPVELWLDVAENGVANGVENPHG
jgi:hypothetical protein